MTVVVGGVGNIVGTVISALGIGVARSDRSSKSSLNPVLGKILVLGAIILFLQWRPAGHLRHQEPEPRKLKLTS